MAFGDDDDFFGGAFDLNGDGTTDLGEQCIAYQLFEEWDNGGTVKYGADPDEDDEFGFDDEPGFDDGFDLDGADTDFYGEDGGSSF